LFYRRFFSKVILLKAVFFCYTPTMLEKKDKKLERMRKLVNVLPEENLVKVIRALIAEENNSPPPRR
jgi:hypothetical protein